MGLAATQARLCFITARQSDVGFQLTTCAHQKLALSRDLEGISEEYNNALEQRKMVWDTTPLSSGDEVDLTYGLLMNSPSAMTNPVLVTDANGRVVLDNNFANVIGSKSGAAGTLGNYISIDDFITAMGASATKNTNNSGTSGESEVVPQVSKRSLLTSSTINGGLIESRYDSASGGQTWQELYDNNTTIFLKTFDFERHSGYNSNWANDLANILAEFGNDMITGGLNQAAVYDAIQKTRDTFVNNANEAEDNIFNEYDRDIRNDTKNENAICYRNGLAGISARNLVDTFLTYYQQAISGDNKMYFVQKYADKSNYYKSGSITTAATSTGSAAATATTAYDSETANYYATLYDQINAKGWKTDNNVSSKEAFQYGLRNGRYFLAEYDTSVLGYSDGRSYSTITQISDVLDDDAIARAEAKYNLEKTKLSNKEEKIDVEMSTLNTELNSLNTELDSVKSVLNKSIERGFKLFQSA